MCAKPSNPWKIRRESTEKEKKGHEGLSIKKKKSNRRKIAALSNRKVNIASFDAEIAEKSPENQEPLNGLFSRGFSRGKQPIKAIRERAH